MKKKILVVLIIISAVVCFNMEPLLALTIQEAYDNGTLFTNGTFRTNPQRYHWAINIPLDPTIYKDTATVAFKGNFECDVKFSVAAGSGGGGSAWTKFGFYDGTTFIQLYLFTGPLDHWKTYYGDWHIQRIDNNYYVNGVGGFIYDYPSVNFPSSGISTPISFSVTGGSLTADVAFQFQLYTYGNFCGRGMYELDIPQDQVPEPLSAIAIGVSLIALCIKRKKHNKY